MTYADDRDRTTERAHDLTLLVAALRRRQHDLREEQQRRTTLSNGGEYFGMFVAGLLVGAALVGALGVTLMILWLWVGSVIRGAM